MRVAYSRGTGRNTPLATGRSRISNSPQIAKNLGFGRSLDREDQKCLFCHLETLLGRCGTLVRCNGIESAVGLHETPTAIQRGWEAVWTLRTGFRCVG